MPKHTPGPWEFDRMRLPDRETDRRCGFVVNGPERESWPTRICDLRVPAGVEGFAEGEANARLIAAAPDLLHALQNIYSNAAESVEWIRRVAGTAIEKAGGTV